MLFKCFVIQLIIKFHILEDNFKFLQQPKFFLPKLAKTSTIEKPEKVSHKNSQSIKFFF
jgi:hypothetical protein